MYTLKKSLGQHFLKDENVCKKIVDAIQQYPHQRLLEVGPGGGALTKYLLQIQAIEFKAVELDTEKVDYLLSIYADLKGKLINQNFLDMEKPFTERFSVTGNFPYNISSQILFKVLEWKEDVVNVVGMFQKEVAQRVAAKEGSKTYGVTSVLVQAFFKVEYLFEVSESSFTPPPKVKSAVIRLLPLEKNVEMKDEGSFFRLVKSAFNQRRKMLRNAVKGLFDPEILKDEIFNKRAEQLSVQEFGELSFKMK
jgi:16S rRNA (adenine1518-N6/adenine1519-N6)-dimethyltransferase